MSCSQISLLIGLLHVFFYLSTQFCATLAGQGELRLYQEILENYNPLVRPVMNVSFPVDVKLGIDLQQIIDVDEKNQILVSNIWIKLEWRDVYLVWDPREYEGVKEIRLPQDRVWKPDVLLYNSADKDFNTLYPSNVVVSYDGSINWIPPGVIKSTCKIDIQWFPFDDQRCNLKFGSWTYSQVAINLLVGQRERTTYMENGEWLLKDILVNRTVFKYDCCPDPYVDITFTFWIRRRTLYYGFNLIIPCVLISSMTLLAFTLPPESGEKLTLGVTIFMSLCVFLLMVAEAMPPTSDSVPLIEIYFSCIMLVVTASIVFTVVVQNLHYRSIETSEMSETMRSVFLCWLPWLLMVDRPGIARVARQEVKNKAIPQTESKSLLANILDMEEDCLSSPPDSEYVSVPVLVRRPSTRSSLLPETHIPRRRSGRLAYRPPGAQDNGGVGYRMEKKVTDFLEAPNTSSAFYGDKTLQCDLREVLHELRYIADRMRMSEVANEISADWKFAGKVMDRLCLIIFTSFMVISTCSILFAAPHVLA